MTCGRRWLIFRCQGFYSDYILVCHRASFCHNSDRAPNLFSSLKCCPLLTLQGGGSPDAAVLGIQGFHPENEGVNFREAFRWGLSGEFERFTQVP